MICILPLLVEAEMHSHEKFAMDLAVAFAVAMANHDNLMEDACGDDRALANPQHALQFCWAAANNTVPPIHYSVALSPIIMAWSKRLHTSHTMPVSVTMQGADATPPSNNTLQTIALTMGSLNENVTAQYMLASDREDKKANGFRKLGSRQQRMILNASSIDKEQVADAPTVDLTSFLQLKTTGLAHSHLKY
jgi:hypothetical protein